MGTGTFFLLAGIKIMISELGNIFCCHMRFCHGASAEKLPQRKKYQETATL